MDGKRPERASGLALKRRKDRCPEKLRPGVKIEKEKTPDNREKGALGARAVTLYSSRGAFQ